MNNIKRLLAAVALCVAVMDAGAQNGFNMPYSQFGIGSGEQPYNLPMVTRMGGVVYTTAGNNHINPFNPASYGAIETESFVFDMGVGLQMSTLRDNTDHLYDADGNLSYLLMAMPLTKWWKVAVGLMPYSEVNYESVETQNVAGAGDVKTVYFGSGGVNEVILGTAFNVLRGDKGKRPSLTLGINANWLTGSVQRAISYAFQGNDSTYYMNGRRYRKTTVGNVTVDVGLQLRQPLGDRWTLGAGMVYKPYMDLKVKDLALIYTYHTSDESLVDTIFPGRGQDAGFDSRMEQAHTFGLGLSLERNKRWRVAADVTMAAWQGMKYTEGQTPSVMGDNAMIYGPWQRYALGYEKMGDMDAASYWGRMSWSLGAHLEQGDLWLTLDGTEHRIDEWGLGAGVTMPMRKGRSLLTLSVGYSSFGSLDVLQRNTFTVGIAVSSCEHWFFKRKYN